MARIKKNKAKIFLTLSFIFLAGLTFCYVFQVSQVAQASYEIGQCERQLEKDKKETARLESSLLKNSTLEKYEQQLNDLGYQKVQKIDYVVVSGSVVAQNR